MTELQKLIEEMAREHVMPSLRSSFIEGFNAADAIGFGAWCMKEIYNPDFCGKTDEALYLHYLTNVKPK